MSCEHFKNTLTEAAATGAEPSSTLRTHLETCLYCRTALAEEQQLFTAVDVGLRKIANAEPSPSFLPRVRTRLDGKAIARRGWLFPWVAVAASAAILIMIVAVWNRRVDVPLQNPENNTAAHGLLSGESSPARSGVAKRNSISRGVRGQGRLRKSAELSPNEDKDSVLIPPGQEKAFNRLLCSLRRGQTQPEELLGGRKENQSDALEIAPLQVSPMEINPLRDVGGE